MSIWPTTEFVPGLRGAEGVLLSVRISVDPRLLEDLLDALAGLSFPVNPEIHHPVASHPRLRRMTTVEFPAYENRVGEVRELIARRGFDPSSVRVASMLEEIRAAGDHGVSG